MFQRVLNPTASLFCATYRHTGSTSSLFAKLARAGAFRSERVWEGPWRSLIFGKVNNGNRRILHHSHSHCQVPETSPAFSIFSRPRSNLPSSRIAVAFQSVRNFICISRRRWGSRSPRRDQTNNTARGGAIWHRRRRRHRENASGLFEEVTRWLESRRLSTWRQGHGAGPGGGRARTGLGGGFRSQSAA